MKRHAWTPLTMTWPEVAETVFRRSESWLRDHMPPDFPRPDKQYNLFSAAAVTAWARRHWGEDTRPRSLDDETELLMRRAHGSPEDSPSDRQATKGPNAVVLAAERKAPRRRVSAAAAAG